MNVSIAIDKLEVWYIWMQLKMLVNKAIVEKNNGDH